MWGWVQQDSNLQPAGYEPDALTVELWTRRAADGIRTRDMQLGRLPFYQLNYSRECLAHP